MPISVSEPHLSFNSLSLIWPDGTPCFENLTGAVSAPVTALIGDNGSGKSTLLKLLAGTLEPTSGSISRPGTVAYLPQDLGLTPQTTIADLFATTDVLDALTALEAGAYSEELYDRIGDNWDAAEQAQATLAASGFSPALAATDARALMQRTVGTLSGGEAVTAALTALVASRPGVLLLDEPTNNLDADARATLYRLLDSLPCPVLVVSHDRNLLEWVDEVLELRQGPCALSPATTTPTGRPSTASRRPPPATCAKPSRLSGRKSGSASRQKPSWPAQPGLERAPRLTDGARVCRWGWQPPQPSGRPLRFGRPTRVG